MTKELGSKIKFERKKQGKTLKDIHLLSKLSISYLSDIENGRRNPSLESLRKIAYALGFKSWQLMETLEYLENKSFGIYLANLRDEACFTFA